MNEFRIAWLLPVAWFYWQPALSEFTQLFPQTTVFTGLFPGFAKGLEGSLRVEVVGRFRVIELTRDEDSYGDNFTYLSPGIVGHLLRLRPQVIFSSSFGVWTIIALLLKPLLGWRVVIAYEGSSPGVDYRNSALRLFVRRFMVWLADACISNSRAGGAYLMEILRARADRVFVQPYEIPDEKTLPGDSPSTEVAFPSLQRPIFLFVGHVIPRKGLPLLLNACAVLQERGYENYTLVVVGEDKFIQGGLPAEKLAFKTNFLHPAPQPGTGEGGYALFVGRLSVEKGLGVMLDAWRQLGGKIRLKILGDGPMAGLVTEAVKEMPEIEWLGRIPLEQVYEVVGNAAFLVFPSEWYETFGRVAIEAFAKGTPVVASKIGAITELIDHKRTGLHFLPSNPTDLADKINWLLEHPQELSQMRQEARAEFEAKYTAEDNYKRLMEIYQSTLGKY